MLRSMTHHSHWNKADLKAYTTGTVGGRSGPFDVLEVHGSWYGSWHARRGKPENPTRVNPPVDRRTDVTDDFKVSEVGTHQVSL